MKKIFSLLLAAIFVVGNIYASDYETHVFGHVSDAKTGEMLPHITVTVVGTTIGTSTDTTGHYILNDVPEDTEFTIEVSALGYNTVTRTLKVNNGEPVEIDFALTEQQVSLDAVVVSANRNVTTRREAPSLVSVLDQRLFDVTTSPTVAEGLTSSRVFVWRTTARTAVLHRYVLMVWMATIRRFLSTHALYSLPLRVSTVWSICLQI